MEFKLLFDSANKNDILLLIGNGSSDEQILRELFPKFDGLKYSVALSASPQPYRRSTGLTSTINSLSLLMHKSIKPQRVIIVIDREHVKDKTTIERTIREHGFEIIEDIQLEERAFKLILSRGGFKFTLYIAVMGETKSIEEDIAKLEKLVYGDKEGRSPKRIVRKADYTHLADVFSNIYKIVEDIEKEE